VTARIPWPYAAAMPIVWFGHVALSYLVVGLHCHQELLEGDILGLAGIRVLQLALTLGAATALVLCGLRVWRPLHASGDAAERNFALATALLAGIFLVYLAWTIAPVFTVQPCHR
jgi:hypothetical protein